MNQAYKSFVTQHHPKDSHVCLNTTTEKKHVPGPTTGQYLLGKAIS
jgi:hypothetical protein